jgi:hypothetical protein
MSAFTTFLTDTQLILVTAAVAFVAGVVLSQRVKDSIKGVPAEARTALNGAEVNVLAAIKQAQADAVSKLLPAAAKVVPPAAPAPVTPPAPPAPPAA